MAAVAKLGKPIQRIVLTHGHADHVGSLDMLKQAHPEAIVMISKRDAKLLAGDHSLDPDEPNTPIRGSLPKGMQTKADLHIADGDRIESLLVIAVPGHTPGSMAFLDTRNDCLIAGDALQTRGGVAVSGTLKPWFPFPAMATWNKAAALESAKRLRELKPSLLAVGHGQMISNLSDVLNKAITEAQTRLSYGSTIPMKEK